MGRSRLVEEPVDRQAFFLAGRCERLALGVEFNLTLVCTGHPRGRIERSAPATGRQRQAERQHQRAERGKTNCWTDGTHGAPLRHSDTYNRSSAAREWQVAPLCL